MGTPPIAARAAWRAACAAAGCDGVTGAEEVPVEDACGRVTADAVRAVWSAPAFACAAMDGIAVRAADTATAPVVLARGRFDEVDTGDPIPDGRDAVVMREHLTRHADGAATVPAPAAPGQHVRPVGEDLHAGELLLPPGHRLRPVDLAAVAAGGHRVVRVRRRPVVAIVPTGDEVRPLGADLARGEVLDTNSLMLSATLRRAGCIPRVAPVASDDPQRIAAAVRAAAMGADLVAVLAGSSAGRDDHTARVVDALGSVVVHGVAVRPGHPVLLGMLTDPSSVPVIGVPGYPVSAALAAELFALPLLAERQGVRPPRRPTCVVRLAADVPSPRQLEEYVLVGLDGTGAAVPLRRGAGVRTALMRADGVLRIPVGDVGHRAGDRVEVERLLGSPDTAASVMSVVEAPTVADRRSPARPCAVGAVPPVHR
ncbi:MAG TPA: molybdopterin-binding protein [Pseudonocardia sp.]|nr:molybdopterin-binding protein [Pseudonocardia sp.]